MSSNDLKEEIRGSCVGLARMRFAAFSDIHGDHRSLSEILDLVKPEGVDFLVFAGDMTDAEYSGYIRGVSQMEAISSMIEASGLEMIYILGNRDRAGGREVVCNLPGNLSFGDREIEGMRFTTRSGELDDRSIYVCHHLDPEFRKKELPAYLVLYGHNHVHRIYKSYVGLGYVRDPKPDDPKAPRGGLFIIDVDGGSIDARFINLGGLKESTCKVHEDQGTFFVSTSFGDECPMCRNDEKYRFHFT